MCRCYSCLSDNYPKGLLDLIYNSIFFLYLFYFFLYLCIRFLRLA